LPADDGKTTPPALYVFAAPLSMVQFAPDESMVPSVAELATDPALFV
jgi:hypothetical protein